MQHPAIFVRLPAWLDDTLRTRADELGITRQTYVRNLLSASLGPKTNKRADA